MAKGASLLISDALIVARSSGSAPLLDFVGLRSLNMVQQGFANGAE
jgi:hypothetical protein